MVIPDWLSFRAKNRLVEALEHSDFPMSRAARAAYEYLTTYFPPTPAAQSLDRIVGFYLLLRALRAEGISGDVIECGVGRGISLTFIGYFMQRLEFPGKLYGFDSFEGFPEPSKHDASTRNAIRGDLWSRTSQEFVRDHFAPAAFNGVRERLTLVPGFFDRSLVDAPSGDIALLHLDVDLYESYKTCLEKLGPRVKGVIVYDEYRSPKWPGATRAIDEGTPALNHQLYFSRTLQRHLSLSTDLERSGFNRRVIEQLECDPITPSPQVD